MLIMTIVLCYFNHLEEKRQIKKMIASGLMLTLLLIGMLTLAFSIEQVKASGTIYIRADGSIDPPHACWNVERRKKK